MNSIVAAMGPKIVVTAPDGLQLWIDPTQGEGDTSLWPKGATVSLQFGDMPEDQMKTDSTAEFMAREAGLILSLPVAGIPVWAWLLGAGAGAWLLCRRR